MALRRTLIVVTAKDTIHCAASAYSCFVFVQFHRGVTIYIGINVLCTLTTAVGIVCNGTASEAYLGVMLHNTTFAAAIDGTTNSTASDIHERPYVGSVLRGIVFSVGSVKKWITIKVRITRTAAGTIYVAANVATLDVNLGVRFRTMTARWIIVNCRIIF